TAKQQIGHTPPATVVHPVARPHMNSHLVHTTSDWGSVTEIPRLSGTNPGQDAPLADRVTQTPEPLVKPGRAEKRDHGSVSFWIHGVKKGILRAVVRGELQQSATCAWALNRAWPGLDCADRLMPP